MHVDTPAGGYTIEADVPDRCHRRQQPDPHAAAARCPHLARHRPLVHQRRALQVKPLPTERWTWIDAPFNEGRAVWQHLMADGVWRIDYQMAEHADPAEASRPEVARARLREQLGAGVEFEFVWIGPYSYRDHLLDEFRHGRLFFIGDSAHVVSPFGARGGNTGIQDAAQPRLEAGAGAAGPGRRRAARHLRRRTPAGRGGEPAGDEPHRPLPGAALGRRAHVCAAPSSTWLAATPFARSLVNTGRMSVANDYPPSRWLPEGGRTAQNVPPSTAPALMRLLAEGTRFLGLWFGEPVARPPRPLARLEDSPAPVELRAAAAESPLAAHLGARAGSFVLVRPDAYVAATLHDAAEPRHAQPAGAPRMKTTPTSPIRTASTPPGSPPRST